MKTHRSRRLGLVLAAIALILVPAAVAVAGGASSGEATLAKKVPVGVDSDARRWLLGGFSALYPLDPSGHRFVTLTDRGPNGDKTCDGVDGKEIFIPAFAPRLIEFSVEGDRIELDRVRPLRVGNQLASGLANLPSDESSFTSACKLLPNDPFGVDSEGVAVDPRGEQAEAVALGRVPPEHLARQRTRQAAGAHRAAGCDRRRLRRCGRLRPRPTAATRSTCTRPSRRSSATASVRTAASRTSRCSASRATRTSTRRCRARWRTRTRPRATRSRCGSSGST